MSRRRRLALLAALGLGLLVAAAFTLPARIDWDGYRETLAENAGARLGRPIGLNGGLRLRLLPQTVLEADGLTIGTAVDGVELTARALRLRLDPWWLGLGRVVVRELVLVGADVTLPWPPTRLPMLGQLGDLTSLDARIEDSRIRIAGASVEGVSARLLASGPADALIAEGRLSWRGQPLSFTASLGRAGDDGVAPLQITGQAAGSRVSARGVLLAEGGFEGRLDAGGSDLSALLPTPRGAFTASGRITANAELVGVDELALDLAGQRARGGISLRLTQPRSETSAPSGPRLEAALLASNLDLDAWVQALREGDTPALPVGLDLSADAATFRGVALRRLRLAVQLQNGRILVPEASAELPGEARLDASGAGTANTSEWALRFTARRLPEAMAALRSGVPEGAIPAGPASGTLKLVLDERQVALSDIAVSLGGSRVAGTATWRWGERPVLGLGLDFAALDLDPWLTLGGALGAIDVNLRIGAERARWRGIAIEALSLDAAAESGRLVLRRALGRHNGADISALANGTLNPPRVAEAVLEAQGSTTAALLAHWLPVPAPFAGLPARLRATLSGPPEALALRGDLAMDDARLEAQLLLDVVQSRATGTVTLRHPGATRLLGDSIGAAGHDMLGDGSLAVIAQVALRPGVLAAESLDVVAGELRLNGPLTLNLEQPRPRLTGQLSGETWRLPAVSGFAPLPDIDIDLGLRAAQLVRVGIPGLDEPRGTLRLAAGLLALDLTEARLAGGALRGVARLDSNAAPPRWTVEATLEGGRIAAPLLGRAPDIVAGRLDARLSVHAAGHGLTAWRASLGGGGELLLQNGTVAVLDLAALNQALATPGLPGLDAALGDGTTPVSRMALPFTINAGLVRLGETRWESEAGGAVVSGQFDLLRETMDVRIALPRPAGPEIGLRFTGPLDRPWRLAETGAHLRWRSERE